MANMNDIFGQSGNFIKTGDVKPGEILECEIVEVEVIEFGDKKKLAAQLKDGKSYILNKTNATALSIRFGTLDYEKWAGQKFRLIRTTTNYQGSTVECLRVV